MRFCNKRGIQTAFFFRQKTFRYEIQAKLTYPHRYDYEYLCQIESRLNLFPWIRIFFNILQFLYYFLLLSSQSESPPAINNNMGLFS